jgi:cyclophilin family peptidyl-prolyl cis-trans isomerase
VAKRRKRELQHLRQEPSRRRNYSLGNTSPSEIYKPGFPMNILGNIKLFAIVGVVVAIVTVGTALFSNRVSKNNNQAADLPTATPTSSVTVDPNATPSASATANNKQFAAAEQVVDAAKQYTATIKTSKGDIVLKLYADKAPATVNSFVFLAQKGYFDNITFHRVAKNFVIQAGDPTGTGSGGPGYTTKDEPNEIANKRGTLSMAKVSGASEFGSQFFINVKDNPSLDYSNPSANKFYPFAEVVTGMDIVDAIANAPTQGEKPNPPITISTVTIEAK